MGTQYDNWLTKPLEDAEERYEALTRQCGSDCCVERCADCGEAGVLHRDDCELRGEDEVGDDRLAPLDEGDHRCDGVVAMLCPNCVSEI